MLAVGFIQVLSSLPRLVLVKSKKKIAESLTAMLPETFTDRG
jgi:hypothetical protein